MNWTWSGTHLKVRVLYSVGGIATQILVAKDDSLFFLLDVGDGILRDLVSLEPAIYENIRYILFTHGHFDHVGGLYSLLSFYRLIKRQLPLTIFSPPSIPELAGILNLFGQLYGRHLSYDIEHIEFTDRSILLDDIEIRSFPVLHKSTISGKAIGGSIPAVGYEILFNGERIIYTGDTGYFDNLKSLIEGADFALIEGTYRSKESKYHLTLDQAHELGKLAKKYIIIHQQSFSRD